MNTSTLIAQAPAELLLGLGIFFFLAAIILLALSCEAGNYRDVASKLNSLHRAVPGLRPRRRWYFNTGAGNRCAGCGDTYLPS